jgi:lipopolysaccharide assembly outer membrane protein LptD (OstA)
MKTRLLAMLLAVATIAAVPKPNPAPTAVGFGLSDWHVATGQLDANWQTGSFSTPGHIILTRPGSEIQADRAVGNFKNHSATLTGNVVLHDNSGVLTNFTGQTGSHQPATLTCDNLMIDGVTKTYIATGNVHFMQGGSDVRAGRAVMNGVTHELHLYDHVQLQQ